MTLLFKLFYWKEEVKRDIEKRSLSEVQKHLFSDSVFLPPFTNEESDSQGNLTPSGMGEHELI